MLALTSVFSSGNQAVDLRQASSRRQYLLPGLLTLLVMAGALILGLGQIEYLPTLAALAIAPLSFVLTDVFRVVRLHRLIANLLAVVVVVWTMRDFFKQETYGQLFAIARMLVLLQLVLMFQEKTHRLEWQILVLSLLDIVVAAALNLGIHFGLLLIVYLALAVAVVLLIYWEEELQGPPLKPPPPRNERVPWQALLGPPQPAGQLTPAEIWRASPPALTVVARALAILGTTSLFAVVFFVTTPRIRSQPWNGAQRSGAFAGAADAVALPERGELVSSEQVVMRVSLQNSFSRQPLLVQDGFYLHGSVMGRYVHDTAGSRWIRPKPTKYLYSGALELNRGSARSVDSVVEITLEPTSDPQLFCVLPYRLFPETPQEIRYRPREVRMMRGRGDEELTPVEYRYVLGTTALQGSRQLRAVPHANRLKSLHDEDALHEETEAYSYFEPERFPELQRIAREVVQAAENPQSNDLTRGLSLQNHLQQSGQYRYTKQFNFRRRWDLDPLEDFVANHRRGHCEYFASALVLMLRSQGIPARMVIGYKGGDLNPLGGYHLVREKHAHAWVEMYLRPDDVPSSEWAGERSPSGAWFRLDPTPGESTADLVANQRNIAERMTQALDYADVIWREYVVGMSAQRQQDVGYDPFLFGAEFAPEIVIFNFSRSPESASPKTQAPGAFLPDYTSQLWWFFLLFLLGCAVFILWRIRRLRERQRVKPTRDQRARVGWELYERLLALLALRGVETRPTQTAQEVTAGALAAWHPAPAAATDLAASFGTVVTGYQRVRFGGQSLNGEETEAIEKSLQQIAAYEVR